MSLRVAYVTSTSVVDLSEMNVYCVKTADSIEMPFTMVCRLGPRNRAGTVHRAGRLVTVRRQLATATGDRYFSSQGLNSATDGRRFQRIA